MKTALIIIDIQNDYFPGGKFELFNSKQAAQNAKLVLDYFRKEKLSVVHIQHVNEMKNASFFVKGTEGVEIYKEVAPLNGEAVFTKPAPNSFFMTGLDEYLKREGIKHLVVCGMMSHMCIDTTVRAAKDLGYTITLLHDACTTRDLTWDNKIISAKTVHETFMAAINGTFANVISVDKFLDKSK